MTATVTMAAVGARHRAPKVERLPVLIDADQSADATRFSHGRTLPPVPPARPRPATRPRP